jgi:O-antigen ligase/cytochrome c-type biogenesis protein CcmH/NrfG
LVGLVLANLWWTTLCLGGYRPETMPVTVTLNAVAVLVWLGLAAWRRRGLQLHAAALATLPFLLYAAVNVGWVTPVRWLGWQDWLGWAQMAAVFWVVLHGIRGTRMREILWWGLAALGVVAAGMAVYQHFADPRWLMMGRVQAVQFVGRSSGPFGIPNSLAAFLNLLLPPLVALALQRRAGAMQRILCGYLAAVLAAGILLTVSRGAWLSLGAALVVWPLLVGRSPLRRLLGSAAVAAVLVAVVGAVYLRAPEVKQRVDQLARTRIELSRTVMWRAGWQLFLDRPVWGTGAGSYAVMFERHRPQFFWDNPQWAHNDYLNTLSDYGALGFLLSFGVMAAFGWHGLRHLARREGGAAEGPADGGRMRALRVGAAIGLLAFALQLFVDFNLKIPALAEAAAILLALALPSGAADGLRIFRPSLHLPGIVPAGLAVLVAALVPAWILPLYRAESARYNAREQLDRAMQHPPAGADGARLLQDVRKQLTHATQLDPCNAQAWADLADALIQLARAEPARAAGDWREAEAAATRALDLTPAVADFWLRRGLAFDGQGRWRDAWADFTEALALAPHRADIWYYYAYHLSLRDLESARSALATCLRLDPWNGPALALLKHLGGKNH